MQLKQNRPTVSVTPRERSDTNEINNIKPAREKTRSVAAAAKAVGVGESLVQAEAEPPPSHSRRSAATETPTVAGEPKTAAEIVQMIHDNYLADGVNPSYLLCFASCRNNRPLCAIIFNKIHNFLTIPLRL